jgi:uncharacterized protein YegL
MRLEKRRSQRLDFGITILHNGKRRMTKDISSSGTFIKSDERSGKMSLFPIGSEIDLSLDIPTAKDFIDVKGVVVHHGSNGDGMGIWFKKIDERKKEFIKRFVADYLPPRFLIDDGKEGM